MCQYLVALLTVLAAKILQLSQINICVLFFRSTQYDLSVVLDFHYPYRYSKGFNEPSWTKTQWDWEAIER